MATHGKTRTPEFRIWSGIKTRCFNSNAPEFKNYGGRGIKMCARWSASFEAFLADMGRRPSIKHSIERVENDGDYEPGNCVWVLRREQARNKRNSVRLKYRGQVKLLVAWAEELGIDEATIRMRLKRGWTVVKALSTPTIATGRWA